jgi:hypothetical protein
VPVPAKADLSMRMAAGSKPVMVPAAVAMVKVLLV